WGTDDHVCTAVRHDKNIGQPFYHIPGSCQCVDAVAATAAHARTDGATVCKDRGASRSTRVQRLADIRGAAEAKLSATAKEETQLLGPDRRIRDPGGVLCMVWLCQHAVVQVHLQAAERRVCVLHLSHCQQPKVPAIDQILCAVQPRHAPIPDALRSQSACTHLHGQHRRPAAREANGSGGIAHVVFPLSSATAARR
ncbi:hypothetical protein EC988_008860, partial [Linderina pennispora]